MVERNQVSITQQLMILICNSVCRILWSTLYLRALDVTMAGHEQASGRAVRNLLALGTSLYEHHDFFLGSQYLSLSIRPRGHVLKHAMPAQVWEHDIYSFLELF